MKKAGKMRLLSGFQFTNIELSGGISLNMFAKRIVITLLLTFLASYPALSDVAMTSVFGDNMVLQRKMNIPVWGTADPGEKIVVSINGKEAKTTAGNDGRWMVRMDKMSAGGPFKMTVKGNNSITFANVMVGEVWVCSGQSNMQWSMERLKNIEDDVASANYPNIRLFSVERVTKDTPQYEFSGKKPEWTACTPETVLPFSSVAYFFGREVHNELGIPVGLIHSSWGGTPAESWTTWESLESEPELNAIIERWAEIIEDYPEAKVQYEKKLAEWEKAKAEGKQVSRMPGPPRGPGHQHYPSSLYNAMISPLIPYGIGGAIWYQGESNAGRAYQYRKLFPIMIQDWRMVWKQGDFPFLFVQLANFRKTVPEPVDSDWAELREAQLMTLSLPNTAMAVIIDIGEADNIHPQNKQEVGSRLALGALKVAFNRDIVHSGPIYHSMYVDNGKIRLRIHETGSGLVAKGGGSLKGFAIAGDDRKFVWADAKIEGDEIVVWSDRVPDPAAVRYAWADNPICNLYNREGLPASPFRTDNWTGITAGKLKP